MARQYFEAPREPLPNANLATITTASATEALLWTVAPWTSFAANELTQGQAWRLFATGTVTTPAAAGTLTMTPRFGTATGSTSLGASIAGTGTNSQTTVPWQIIMTLMVRSVSTPTTAGSGVIVGAGTFESNAVSRDLIFGGTLVTTADTTIAQGLAISVNTSVASWVFVPQTILFASLN
jgi:hypothetical protein